MTFIGDTYPLVICAECKSKGQKSKVHFSSSSTLMTYSRYYDENGKYHSHNPNALTWHYICSKGHSWNVSTNNPCPQEDY